MWLKNCESYEMRDYREKKGSSENPGQKRVKLLQPDGKFFTSSSAN